MKLQSTKKRVIPERQVKILELLLRHDVIIIDELVERTMSFYSNLKSPVKALIRDLNYLERLKAISVEKKGNDIAVSTRLTWATEITETKFFEATRRLPQAKTHLIHSL
jgi:hypothetical protein